MRVKRSRGFTLIEIVFTMTLVVILAALSLWTLRPASSKAPSRGLAMALAEEFGAARQLAISSGHPVALGIPTDKGNTPLASSIYRLEGWNLPTVTWSKGFSGDYPNCGFAAASWSGGGTWSHKLDPSVVSKLGGFDLIGQWLPANRQDDYIFCFTPEGGLETNKLPSLDGRYTVVVGQNLDVSGGVVKGAKDPITLFISPYGGVEVVTGMPGSSVSSGGSASALISQPVPRTDYAPGQVRISNIVVRPNLDPSATDKAYCVPGQYVTLEVYAYDPQGRGLFAKWKQPRNKGIFTYPDGGASAGAVLESEVDRMEFVTEEPPGLTWSGVDPPAGGLFRARWGWTVPQDSLPGTTYDIEVDVKDVKGECEIVNPPAKITMRTAPAGRIIAEREINGIWQLVQLNPDGSGMRVISPPGVEEVLASIDHTGTKMAFLQGPAGNRYVKVRALDGGYERNISLTAADYTSVSLSPDGAWISYRNNSTNELTTRKVDSTAGQFVIPNQTWGGTPSGIPRSRSGWTRDSKFLLYEMDTTIRYRYLGGGPLKDDILVNTIDNSGVTERLFAPTTYTIPLTAPDVQERMLFSLGNVDPVLVSVAIRHVGTNALMAEMNPTALGDFLTAPSAKTDPMMPDLDGPSVVGAGSHALDDSYPSIAHDGSFLALSRSPEFTGMESGQETVVVPLASNGNFVGDLTNTVIRLNTRRAIWLP